MAGKTDILLFRTGYRIGKDIVIFIVMTSITALNVASFAVQLSVGDACDVFESARLLIPVAHALGGVMETFVKKRFLTDDLANWNQDEKA
jgi:hypothetical protein